MFFPEEHFRNFSASVELGFYAGLWEKKTKNPTKPNETKKNVTILLIMPEVKLHLIFFSFAHNVASVILKY